MLAFKISLVAGEPSFDSLPVAKITDYPLEKHDYKPYAQARICLSQTSLYIQMWAFEVNPEKESSLKIVLAGEGLRSGFSAELWSTGQLEFSPWGSADATASPELHPLWGEDLQGVFWGGTLKLPIEPVRKLLGEQNLQPGSIIKGNIYKLSTSAAHPHMGSLFPAQFGTGDPFGPASMGDFEVVSY